MRGSWLLVPFLLGSALADSRQSSRLAMDYVDAETIHLAGQDGAINHHAAASIEVELLTTQHKVVVSDHGSRSEHNLYETYSTEDQTTWLNTWSGTWSLDGDVLRLRLELHEHRCTHVKTQTGAAPQDLPCPSWSHEVDVQCRAEQVTLEDADRPAKKVAAWRCAPSGQVDLGETPAVWVLGKPGCIQVVGGGRSAGASYHGCPGAR